MASPCSSHLHAAFRILRYLKNAPGQGLFYPVHNYNRLQAFSDSDWATCSTTRRSVTGYCVFYDNCLISWKSKKQNTVSRSSIEAEYMALATVACELQWLKYIVDDLSLNISLPIPTYCDNQSTIQLVKNPSFHERTKHIEVDCHFIRSKISDGLIVLSHVPSKHQLADAFLNPCISHPSLPTLPSWASSIYITQLEGEYYSYIHTVFCFRQLASILLLQLALIFSSVSSAL